MTKLIPVIIRISALLILTGTGYSQIADHYGIRFGAGSANQYWDYDKHPNLSDWKKDNVGFVVYLNAEKEINKYFSLKPEIGYIQKGFWDEIHLTDINGEVIETVSDNVILHNLSMGLVLKIQGFDMNINPYIFTGFRVDYLISYKDFQIEYQGSKYGVFKELIDKYNKFVVSGLIGLGCEIGKIIYVDIEYNPAITKNYDDNGLTVNNRYMGLTLGVNIDALVKNGD